MPDDSAQHMQCMEIWGGNQPFDNAVIMAGLDAWVYSKPYGQSEAGGDVYYVSSCATGRITRLLIADVSGHGKAVSEIAGSLRGLMRQYVNYIDQSAFVREMNRKFAEMSDAGTFATAIVSTFFGPTNDLTLCIAGHPSPLLYRAKEKKWMLLAEYEMAEGNIPLGIDDVTDWTQFGVRLGVGDLVLCYTDSLIESRDADGEMLGVAGLLQVAQTIDVTDPAKVITNLLSAIEKRAEGNLSADDVTAMLFRPNGLAPRVPFGKRVAAPFRMVGAIYGSLFQGKGPIPWPEFTATNILGATLGGWFNRLWSRRNTPKARAS